MAAIDGLAGTSVAKKFALDSLVGPVVGGPSVA